LDSILLNSSKISILVCGVNAPLKVYHLFPTG